MRTLAGGILTLVIGIGSAGAAPWWVDRFPVPTPNSLPTSITPGPDGALWYLEPGSNQVGRITTMGAQTEFPIPTPGSLPFGLVAGGGALWFTESGAGRIGRITTGGQIDEFEIPDGGSPTGIAVGPDGLVWFANGSQRFGRIAADGSIMTFVVAISGAPYGLTPGPDRQLWFTVPGSNRIGRINSGAAAIEFTVPTNNSYPTSLVTGADGNVWFVEGVKQVPFAPVPRIGRISTMGTFLEFTVDTPGSELGAITLGPDGRLWFTDVGAGAIRAINRSGKIGKTNFKAKAPTSITLGPDGSIWFTEEGNTIGRIRRQPGG